MDETSSRFLTELMSRSSGPFAFRFILQPTMAALYAIRDGKRDAKNGRPAYFWAVFTQEGAHRRELIQSGWRSIGKVMVIALIMDLAYQLIAQRAFRLLDALVIVIVLAVLPYVLLRGPVNRVLRKL